MSDGPLNLDYVDKMIAQIKKIPDCKRLEEEVNKLMQLMVDKMMAYVKQLGVLNKLVINPTDLPSVITWINNVIEVIAGPIAKIAAAQAQLAAKVVEVQAAVNEAIAGLQCTFEPPTMPTLEDIEQEVLDNIDIDINTNP